MTAPSLTILRTSELLDLLSQNGQELGVREIARRLQWSRSTAHRLLASLEHVGLVEHGPATGKYRLGYKAAYWAAHSSGQSALREKAMPHMVRLRDAVQETVGLSVRVQRARTYLAQVESPHDIRWSVEIGRLYPLYAGAPGKLLLAFLPGREVDAILKTVPRRRFTPRTPTSLERIRAELQKIRRQGMAMARGEIVEGSATIAAPVRDARGVVVAAVSISGPAFRFTGARRLAALPVLQEAAEGLSRDLGFKEGVGPPGAQPQRRVPAPRKRGGKP